MGEITKYNWEYLIGPRLSEITCADDEDTCERATCECDKIFALQLEEKAQYFNPEFHVFWSHGGWNPAKSCVAPRVGEHVERACCGAPKTGPFFMYNQAVDQCCEENKVKSIGSC